MLSNVANSRFSPVLGWNLQSQLGKNFPVTELQRLQTVLGRLFLIVWILQFINFYRYEKHILLSFPVATTF